MAGILLIGAYGLVHLVEAPEHYEDTPYVGMLFVANLAGVIPTVVGIYQVGDSFEDYLGIPSLLVEALFITLFLMVAAKYITGHVKRAAIRHEKGDSRVL